MDLLGHLLSVVMDSTNRDTWVCSQYLQCSSFSHLISAAKISSVAVKKSGINGALLSFFHMQNIALTLSPHTMFCFNIQSFADKLLIINLMKLN